MYRNDGGLGLERRTLWLAAWSAACVAGLACSSKKFDDCESTKTCEADGSAGQAGATAGSDGRPRNASDGVGGFAGADPAGDPNIAPDSMTDSERNETRDTGGSSEQSDRATCSDDVDCDDGLACTGEESCNDGRCVAGEEVTCANPDEDHCQASCVEQGQGSYECVIEANDADGDGFGTTRCEAASGEDCDDQNDRVHPGAEEVCDGFDNDCNGAFDLDDGLELAGSTSTLEEARAIDVGWSPESEAFGVAHVTQVQSAGLSNRAFFLGALAPGGRYQAIAEIGELAGAPSSNLRLEWGAGNWTLWEPVGPLGAPGTQVHLVDATGTHLAQITRGVAQSVDAAWRTTGDWVAVRRADSVLNLDRLIPTDDTAAFVAGDTLSKDASKPRIATDGEAAAVVWQIENTNRIEWALVSSDLQFEAPEELAQDGQHPRIASLDGGYALSWATEDGFSYETRHVDGSEWCPAVSVAAGDGVLDSADTAAPVWTQRGVLVAYLDRGSATLELYRFDQDCELTTETLISNTGDPVEVNVAGGGGQVAVSWLTTETAGHVRAFSDLLCAW